MEAEKLSFPEAVKELARRAGINLFSEEEAVVYKARDAFYRLYEGVANTYSYFLDNSPRSDFLKNYLAKRNLSPKIIEEFKLGYAPSDGYWLHGFLLSKKYSSDFLAESMLFSKKNVKWSFFFDRLMFPIHNRRGQVIAFGGRILDGDGPKYLNSSESDHFQKRSNLYGLYQGLPEIKKQKKVIVVEGYIDVLAFFEAGLPVAVAPLGTAFTADQAKIIKPFVDEVVLCFDGDEAGQNAALKSARICEGLDMNVSVIPMAPGRDPGDILEKDGPEALKKVLEFRINIFEFLLKGAEERSVRGGPESKIREIRKLFDYLDTIVSEIRKNSFLQDISSRLNIDYRALLDDYANHNTPVKKTVVQENPKRYKKITTISKDLYLLLAVLAEISRFSEIREQISVDDLEDPVARELFIVLEDNFRRQNVTLEHIIADIENEELRNVIAEKMSGDEFRVNQQRLVKDSLLVIRRRKLEKKRWETEQRLKSLPADAGNNELQDLLVDKMFLDKELDKLKGVRNDESAE